MIETCQNVAGRKCAPHNHISAVPEKYWLTQQQRLSVEENRISTWHNCSIRFSYIYLHWIYSSHSFTIQKDYKVNFVFPFLKIIFSFCIGLLRIPQTGGLMFSQFQETGSPRSRCWQECILMRPLSLTYRLPFHCDLTRPFPLCVCSPGVPSSSYKDTCSIGLGPHLCDFM